MRSILLSTVVLMVVDVSSAMLRPSLDNEFPTTTSMEKPRYSNDWAVEVNGGATEADRLAAKHGFVNMGQVGSFENHYHFQLLVNTTATSGAVEGTTSFAKSVYYKHIRDRTVGSLAEIGLQSAITTKLKSEYMVGRVEQQQLKKHSKKEFVHPSDPKFDREWSLLNTGQIGTYPFFDLNVERAWMQGITGEGVVVGFVDDGLEHKHPDLQANYDPLASYDFVYNDHDPTPTKYTGEEPDRHGTSCAGEVGMSKDNNNCGVGVAYGCQIGGLKMDLGGSDDLAEATALSYKQNYTHVYSNSWGPSDHGFIVEGPGYYLSLAFEYGVIYGRNGRGSIFVWAAGNGGKFHDSCAADGYASSIYTIAVGSADQDGKQADYDESCASKMAVTYSYDSRTFPSAKDEWNPYNQLTTTTLNGKCTDDFTGTSASTPLMSGVAALALQANPQLSWRDMQYLLAYTSDTSKLVDGDWQINGRGLKVSHKFGFGAVDAEALVSRARRWTTVPNKHIHTLYSSYWIHRELTIPSSSSQSTTFQVESSAVDIVYLEHVVVNMTLVVSGYDRGYDISDLDSEYYVASDNEEIYDWLEDPHPRRGDIKIELTSPQGTVSTLLPYRNYDFVNEEGYSNWPFMSVQHWGENPSGTWTLTVTFQSSSGLVTASGISMTLHGTPTLPQSVSAIPRSCDPACARNCSGPQSSDCDACKDYRVASTLECVSTCPTATYVHNKYCLSGSHQPDHKITYPDTSTSSPASSSPSSSSPPDQPTDIGGKKKTVYIASGTAAVFLLLIIVFVVVCVAVVCKTQSRKRRSTRFVYSPISPTAV